MSVLRAVTISLSLLALTACPAPKTAKPVTTAKGTVEGMPLTTKLGPAGGVARSGSGDLSVTIPAGALAADTDITLTPITRTAPGSRGRAYRLGPDDVTFAAPVTLTFSYSEDDLQGTSADALAIAWQHASGYWALPDDVTLDTTAKTVSVKATHFSDWSMVAGAQLRPPSKKVQTKQSLELRVVSCFYKPPEQPPGVPPELAPLWLGYQCDVSEADVYLPVTATDWAVNGTAGGNSTVGTVKSGGLDGATFTAPNKKPTPATVAVSARVPVKKGKVLVSSNVTITDSSPNLLVKAEFSKAMDVIPFVRGTVTDSYEFEMQFPPVTESPMPRNTGQGVAGLMDTRSGCPTPKLGGDFDELHVEKIAVMGSAVTVTGTRKVPAVTVGTGEGACQTTRVEPATSSPASVVFSLPVEFFTTATPPPASSPLVVTDGDWKYTYQEAPQ